MPLPSGIVHQILVSIRLIPGSIPWSNGLDPRVCFFGLGWVSAPRGESAMRLERDHTLEDITLERYVLSDTAREDYLASYEGNRFAESIRSWKSSPPELEK